MWAFYPWNCNIWITFILIVRLWSTIVVVIHFMCTVPATVLKCQFCGVLGFNRSKKCGCRRQLDYMESDQMNWKWSGNTEGLYWKANTMTLIYRWRCYILGIVRASSEKVYIRESHVLSTLEMCFIHAVQSLLQSVIRGISHRNCTYFSECAVIAIRG